MGGQKVVQGKTANQSFTTEGTEFAAFDWTDDRRTELTEEIIECLCGLGALPPWPLC